MTRPGRFRRYLLRTTDPVAARAFYAEAFGLLLPDGVSADTPLESWPLHERALARGAPAHWLGHLEADDVDATVDQVVRLGGEALGPTVQGRDGRPFATLRDPFGSVIGIRARGEEALSSPVVWHQLHARDADGAWALYERLFGWSPTETLQVPELAGGLRAFAWERGGPSVGAVGNTARWPGVHPHWLFFFPVTDLDGAVTRVRALGGTTREPVRVPGGMRFVACEDPQGAAFGLTERS